MITLELNDTDAALFREFRQNQDNIGIMLAAGVFDMRHGSVEVHFDMEGKIGAIIGHPTLYKRGSLIVIPT